MFPSHRANSRDRPLLQFDSRKSKLNWQCMSCEGMSLSLSVSLSLSLSLSLSPPDLLRVQFPGSGESYQVPALLSDAALGGRHSPSIQRSDQRVRMAARCFHRSERKPVYLGERCGQTDRQTHKHTYRQMCRLVLPVTPRLSLLLPSRDTHIMPA